MKKIILRSIGFFLSCLILLPIGITAGAETEAAAPNPHMVKLHALGLMDYTSDLQDLVLTRAAYAGALAKLFGFDNGAFADLRERTYADVSESNENAAAIYALQALGIMRGTEAYFFSPEANISYQAAIKALVSALGYESRAEAKGGYPGGYMTVAHDLNLLKGAEQHGGGITTGDCAALFENALEVGVLEISAMGKRFLYQSEKERTLLSVYHGIYCAEGIMTDNGISALSAPTAIGREHVMIDGVTIAADSSARRYLGSYVKAYYLDDNGQLTLLYIEENEKKTNVLVISAEDLIKGETTKTRLSYYEGDKIKTVRISQYADCIYNGAAYPAFTAETMNISAGTITLMQQNGGDYDVVKIDAYDICFVSQVSGEPTVIYDCYGRHVKCDDFDEVELTDTDGKALEVQSLSEYSILQVYQSKRGELLRMLKVNSSPITGILTGVDSGEKIYKIDDTEYSYAESLQEVFDAGYANIKAPEAGNRYTFYTDAEGRIAAIRDERQREQYAYFIAAKQQSGLSARVQLRLFLDTGEIVTATVAEKPELNNIPNSKAIDIMSMAALHVENDLSQDYLPQLVQIQFNAKGEVVRFSVAEDAKGAKLGFTPNRFTLDFEKTNCYWHSSYRLIDSTYFVNAQTKIFMVPDPENFDEDGLEILEISDLWYIHSNLKVYDADETWKCGAVVTQWKKKGEGLDSAQVFVVSKISTVLNENGETVKKLSGYFNKEQETGFLEDTPGLIDSRIPDLAVGDLLRIQFSKGRAGIRDLERVFSPKRDKTPFFERKVVGYATTGSYVDYYGYVCAKNSDAVSITADGGASIQSLVYYGSYPYVYVMDMQSGKVRLGTRADIPGASPMHADGSFDIDTEEPKIYAVRNNGYFWICYVIKDSR